MRSLALLALLVLLATPALAEQERSKEDLLGALSNSNYQVRRKAVLAVEGRKEPELLDRLIEVARSDPHSNLRGYAAEVLGTFRDKRIFPLLAKMATEEEYGPRTHAYVALGKLGGPGARPILLDGLKAGRGLRGYAAKGLGLLGDPMAFEPLKRLLLDHARDPYVAELAPAALVRIRRPAALEFLREQFVQLPSSARISAARVLGRNPDEHTRTMMEGLLDSKDPALRLPAIRVLSDLKDPKSTPALLAHLARRPEERAPVIEALGRTRDPRAVAPLIEALRTPRDLLEKMRLIEALGRLGDKAALAVLRPLLQDTTVLKQPKTISSIRVFPWNARVDAAVAWAILTIRDGTEPFPLTQVSSFPDGQPPPHVVQAIAAVRKWAGR